MRQLLVSLLLLGLSVHAVSSVVVSFMPLDGRFYVTLTATSTADEADILCHSFGATVPTHLITPTDLDALLPLMAQQEYLLQLNVTRKGSVYAFEDELGVGHALPNNLWSPGEPMCTTACGVLVKREVSMKDPNKDTVRLEAVPRDMTSNVMCIMDPEADAFLQTRVGQLTVMVEQLVDNMRMTDGDMSDVLRYNSKAIQALVSELQQQSQNLQGLGRALRHIFSAFRSSAENGSRSEINTSPAMTAAY